MLPVKLTDSYQESFCQSISGDNEWKLLVFVKSVSPTSPGLWANHKSNRLDIKWKKSLHFTNGNQFHHNTYRMMPQWASMCKTKCWLFLETNLVWVYSVYVNDDNAVIDMFCIYLCNSDCLFKTDGTLASGSLVQYFTSFCDARDIRWQVLVNDLPPWHLSKYGGITKLPGV